MYVPLPSSTQRDAVVLAEVRFAEDRKPRERLSRPLLDQASRDRGCPLTVEGNLRPRVPEEIREHAVLPGLKDAPLVLLKRPQAGGEPPHGPALEHGPEQRLGDALGEETPEVRHAALPPVSALHEAGPSGPPRPSLTLSSQPAHARSRREGSFAG